MARHFALPLLAASLPVLVAPAFVTFAAVAAPVAANSATGDQINADANDFGLASKMMNLSSDLKLDGKGTVSFDKKKWSVEKEEDGTELLTAKSKPAARVAVMRAEDGMVESFTAFRLNPAKKSSDPAAESSSSFFFNKGKLSAFTSCEDSAAKDSIGRICVTVTPKLCTGLSSSKGLEPEAVKEMDQFEMRSLAVILTLRGADHQLENVVKSGNRLGLKTALQTTKGQLIAFARQLAKESGAIKGSRVAAAPGAAGSAGASNAPTNAANAAAATLEARDPATSAQPATAPADAAANAAAAGTKASDDKAAQRLAADNAIARKVLEVTLPKLKQACVETKFNAM